jgi:hypothetical protein
MLAILHACGTFILDLFKSRRRLQAENLFLRISTEGRRLPHRRFSVCPPRGDRAATIGFSSKRFAIFSCSRVLPELRQGR